MGKYTAVGNTTAPGDLRFTPNGKAVCNFTVAETTRRFDKQANEWVDDSTTFWRCTVWGKPAESVAESLADKGVRVVVVGDVKTRTWDDKDGNKRSSTELDNCEVALSTLYNPVTVNRGGRGGSQPRGNQSGGGFGRSGFQGDSGGFGGGQQSGFGGPAQPPAWEQDDNTPPF
mgnify:CR=1 FL=1